MTMCTFCYPELAKQNRPLALRAPNLSFALSLIGVSHASTVLEAKAFSKTNNRENHVNAFYDGQYYIVL